MSFRFEIIQDDKGLWYWKLYADYNEFGISSIHYDREEICREAVMSIKIKSKDAAVIPPPTI